MNLKMTNIKKHKKNKMPVSTNSNLVKYILTVRMIL